MATHHAQQELTHVAPLGDVQVTALCQPGTRAVRGHPSLPALVYKGAFVASDDGARAALIERTFAQNGWTNGWRDSVYDFDHFHSTAHEVLGCYRGGATLQLGGPAGPTCQLQAGDVLLLPAGTAHRKLEASDGFAVVGCYAEGRDYDMQCGADENNADMERRLRALPLPERDPVFGTRGPFMAYLSRG